MGYQTGAEILEKWTSSEEAKAEEREIKSIQSDISTARGLIADALARYKKKKLKVRSVKAASEDPFAELADYSTRGQIHDAFG